MVPLSTASGRHRSRKGSAVAERRRSVAELRALAHPLRLRLIECFATPHTAMQVAELIGEPPTRLYHHVNILERAGILSLKKTRQVRGTTEKYYQVTRKQFGMTRGRPASRPALSSLTATVFEEARNELMAAIAVKGPFTPDNAPMALRMLLGVPPSRQKKIRRIIISAIKQIRRELKDCDEAAPRWALTLGFAPTLTKAESEK